MTSSDNRKPPASATDSPVSKAVRELTDSGALKAVRELADSPAMKAVRELTDSPVMKAVREFTDSPTARAIAQFRDSPSARAIASLHDSPVARALASITGNSKAVELGIKLRELNDQFSLIKNNDLLDAVASSNAHIQFVTSAISVNEVEDARVSALGKSSEIGALLKTLGKVSEQERKTLAPILNTLRESVAVIIAERKTALETAELDARLAAETIDLSLPAPPRRKGSVHPTLQAMDECISIFAEMGFAVAEGPDIEDDFHNFTALNFPEKHPAREMHDTFFFNPKATGERMLLRTHTSPVQVRTMMSNAPPIRIVAPGRTYRCDSDATHTPMFHQIEGLVIDKAIHMGHLKWTLETFIGRYFETGAVTTRFRPHHFPFTEPSAEMDVGCDRSGGELKIGQGSDWLEILGCGMVHPNVLRACGIDPDEYQGFAFGMGVDRLAMLKYGMSDLREMFAADTRWLAHYGFSAFAAPNAATGLS